ncbi:VanZ family protein [Lederbergia wuyishanensis]|uniref:Glycopeptide antibiotics resistance protein n=1 Tax=Lederbergia wuyishanensis TaxID=1347903 RepID=A0ABU0D5I6_9BACI|nr:VanZ family protein [Lederbergia wuyishanensis]MCJ8009811.1 VanZ family protein [Lederbergia wuyishanensis]MDQ0343667.1 glycopeptide antibiotics resistance protein [Lederbergia wuyishanensis]
MRLQEITSIIREYFFLALILVIVLGIIFFLGYFIVYRKLLKGKKRLSKKHLLFRGLFTGYVIMVIGVTFLNRDSYYPGGINLSFLSSYKEAWYSFSARNWQFVYLNIIMFVPFGILFPLLHSRFQKAVWTIGVAALFTLFIESIQLITGYGVFEVDDLFNNLLGAIIGYEIIMGFITIRKNRIKRSLVYFSPLMLVVILFGSMFTYYYLKEFGNLSITPNHRINMVNTTITIDDTQLDENKRTVPIYKAPSYTKASANEFVTDFFKRMNIDATDMEVISYPDEGVYWIRDEISYNIWFQFLDGSYSYSDFSSFDEDKEPKDGDEATLEESLTNFGIQIPQDAVFQKVDTGAYEWKVDKKVIGNQLIDGSLTVDYFNDDTVKRINNQLITYDKVKDVQIKSEQEAYKEMLEGKFKYNAENNKIETLHIDKVEISYYLDSKGYYQPVYAFYSMVDGREFTIFIPGI